MKMKLFLTVVMIVTLFFTNGLMAQEEENENPSKFSPGADFYSSFIWRGSRLSGPAFQPYVEFATGGLALGAWGSFSADGYMETDLYATYDFSFGLSLGVTDYYLPDLDFFDISDSTGSHALELTAGYAIKGLSLCANYILNKAEEGIGSTGGDVYLQAGYAFNNVSLFLGAGNGWHTSDGKFDICNVGIETGREIKVTDNFSIPVTGQVVFNPEQKKLFVVVGFSL